MTRRCALLPIVALVAATACRDSSRPQQLANTGSLSLPGAAVPSAGARPLAADIEPDPPEGTCEVTIDGPQPLRARAENTGLAILSDYWASRDEMVDYLTNEAQDNDVADSAIPAYVQRRMAENPIVTPLTINCLASVTVSFSPVPGTTYANVRFGSGSYPIVGKLPAHPGGFVVSMTGGPAGDGGSLVVPQAGTLIINRFDRLKVEGMFSFPAKLGPKSETREVHGTFSFVCVDSALCGR